MLAVHQGIIRMSDLDGLEVGQPFKLGDLIRRRRGVTFQKRKRMADATKKMFVFCRWHEMVPLRYIPSSPQAISTYCNMFGAGADMAITARSLRTGMVFQRIKYAEVARDGKPNSVHIALAGQWTPEAQTFQQDYLHPGYYNALFSHTSLREALGNGRLSEEILRVAIQHSRIQMDTNPNAYRLFVSAQLSAFFLQSPEGSALLARADKASEDVYDAAVEEHQKSRLGGTMEYGWNLIKNLHRKAPAPLWLWGQDRHKPDPETHRKELVDFCALIRASHEGQRGWVAQLQRTFPTSQFDLENIVEDARGQTLADCVKSIYQQSRAGTTESSVAASDATPDLTDPESGAMPGDTVAQILNVSQAGLELTPDELLGADVDVHTRPGEDATTAAERRIEASLKELTMEAVNAKQSAPMKYRDHVYQIGRIGIRTVLYFRKALLRHAAGPLAPFVHPDLRLRDYVKGCGGEIFTNMLQRLDRDDHGLADWLEVLTLVRSPEVCRLMSYEDAEAHRRESEGQTRGPSACCAVVDCDADGRVVLCNAFVGAESAKRRHHVCAQHLKSSLVLAPHCSYPHGRLQRYCEKRSCRDFLPLQRFHGLSHVCDKHTDDPKAGRNLHAVVPAEGVQHSHAVVPDTPQLKTLYVGHDGKLQPNTWANCDVDKCRSTAPCGGICERHSKSKLIVDAHGEECAVCNSCHFLKPRWQMTTRSRGKAIDADTTRHCLICAYKCQTAARKFAAPAPGPAAAPSVPVVNTTMPLLHLRDVIPCLPDMPAGENVWLQGAFPPGCGLVGHHDADQCRIEGCCEAVSTTDAVAGLCPTHLNQPLWKVTQHCRVRQLWSSRFTHFIVISRAGDGVIDSPITKAALRAAAPTRHLVHGGDAADDDRHPLLLWISGRAGDGGGTAAVGPGIRDGRMRRDHQALLDPACPGHTYRAAQKRKRAAVQAASAPPADHPALRPPPCLVRGCPNACALTQSAKPVLHRSGVCAVHMNMPLYTERWLGEAPLVMWCTSCKRFADAAAFSPDGACNEHTCGYRGGKGKNFAGDHSAKVREVQEALRYASVETVVADLHVGTLLRADDPRVRQTAASLTCRLHCVPTPKAKQGAAPVQPMVCGKLTKSMTIPVCGTHRHDVVMSDHSLCWRCTRCELWKPIDGVEGNLCSDCNAILAPRRAWLARQRAPPAQTAARPDDSDAMSCASSVVEVVQSDPEEEATSDVDDMQLMADDVQADAAPLEARAAAADGAAFMCRGGCGKELAEGVGLGGFCLSCTATGGWHSSPMDLAAVATVPGSIPDAVATLDSIRMNGLAADLSYPPLQTRKPSVSDQQAKLAYSQRLAFHMLPDAKKQERRKEWTANSKRARRAGRVPAGLPQGPIAAAFRDLAAAAPPTSRVCEHASAALALVERLPTFDAWLARDSRDQRRTEIGMTYRTLIVSTSVQFAEGIRKANRAIRDFGPVGLVSQLVKAAKPQTKTDPAVAETRRLKCQLFVTTSPRTPQATVPPAGHANPNASGGQASGAADQQSARQSTAFLSAMEANITYSRQQFQGVASVRSASDTHDVRLFQLARDCAVLLAGHSFRATSLAAQPQMQYVHVASAVLMTQLGMLSPVGKGTRDVNLPDLLTVFVWALAYCKHKDHVMRNPTQKHKGHLACAVAVARAWDVLLLCKLDEQSWAHDPAIATVFMSVLACLPRALVEHFGEEYDQDLWDGFAARASRRPGPCADSAPVAWPEGVGPSIRITVLPRASEVHAAQAPQLPDLVYNRGAQTMANPRPAAGAARATQMAAAAVLVAATVEVPAVAAAARAAVQARGGAAAAKSEVSTVAVAVVVAAAAVAAVVVAAAEVAAVAVAAAAAVAAVAAVALVPVAGGARTRSSGGRRQ
eukprot:jgi/Ulvmu1/9172/UM005_0271.1